MSSTATRITGTLYEYLLREGLEESEAACGAREETRAATRWHGTRISPSDVAAGHVRLPS